MVAVALANAQAFGFDTVGCSSTGNLANAVAAGAARLGLKTYILVPADLEPAKILNTQVYGANLIRIDGNYDHCNRLCSQIAEKYNWGFVNVNLGRITPRVRRRSALRSRNNWDGACRTT